MIAMSEFESGSIRAVFSRIDDPRIERSKKHKLIDIITITICGVLCGADSWVDIALFGESKKEWLEGFLELPNGIPSHDTFGDVFSRIDPDQLQECFIEWVRGVEELTRGRLVSVDGKTVRRSHDRFRGKSAIHMVSAWSSANGLVLGQIKTEEKSNEITAIPELLKLLEISGCVVSIDAMGCQKEIARAIVDKEADYVLSLKPNQAGLHEDVRELFDGAFQFGFDGIDYDTYETVGKGHGRIETRQCWTISDAKSLGYIRGLSEWKSLNTVAMVRAERRTGDSVSAESRYYISSLDGDAQRLLSAVRGHWGIENSLHWVLDIAFREDDSRVRVGHAPENLAVIRHIALNLLKQEKSLKVGVNAKRKRAGWDNDYLLKVISI
jgi:predicted transposase YbfD/YdcC